VQLSSRDLPTLHFAPFFTRLTIHNVGITYLDLSRCSGLNLEAMRALNSLPAVTELRLCDNPSWHPSSLRWLFNVADASTADPRPNPSRLTTLTTLDLTGSPQFATADALALLGRQPALATLRFQNAPLQASAADALLDAIPEIETLDLKGCTGITEQGVMVMLTSLPKLANVDITGCRGVTDRVLARLVAAMSRSIRRLCIAGVADADKTSAAVGRSTSLFSSNSSSSTVGGAGGSGKLTDSSIMKLRELKVRIEVRERHES
jgi:hypothetical protein